MLQVNLLAGNYVLNGKLSLEFVSAHGSVSCYLTRARRRSEPCQLSRRLGYPSRHWVSLGS